MFRALPLGRVDAELGRVRGQRRVKLQPLKRRMAPPDGAPPCKRVARWRDGHGQGSPVEVVEVNTEVTKVRGSDPKAQLDDMRRFEQLERSLQIDDDDGGGGGDGGDGGDGGGGDGAVVHLSSVFSEHFPACTSDEIIPRQLTRGCMELVLWQPRSPVMPPVAPSPPTPASASASAQRTSLKRNSRHLLPSPSLPSASAVPLTLDHMDADDGGDCVGCLGDVDVADVADGDDADEVVAMEL
uniref:Uncharacterized protein LOC116938418 n=1 Tax=Petromyzon marinus TaxID=7757 RepID=A0AAJ7WKY3_PETMA|nr:uncharacterized protein LOC116938418 [Petromyzon marinus]